MIQRKNAVRCPHKNRFSRHTKYDGRLLVLRQSQASCLSHGKKATGSILPHSGQKAGRRCIAKLPRQRLEEDVDRRPAGMSLRLVGELNLTSRDNQVSIWWRYQDLAHAPFGKWCSVGRLYNGEGRPLVKPLDQRIGEEPADVDDQQYRQRVCRRQLSEHFQDRAGSTGGGSNSHNPASASCVRPSGGGW